MIKPRSDIDNSLLIIKEIKKKRKYKEERGKNDQKFKTK